MSEDEKKGKATVGMQKTPDINALRKVKMVNRLVHKVVSSTKRQGMSESGEEASARAVLREILGRKPSKEEVQLALCDNWPVELGI
jgi:hypothetical protein